MKDASSTAVLEKYFNILRGPVSHPVARLKYIDDNDVEQTINEQVLSFSITYDRDDEREGIFLLIPPAGILTIELSNESKQFTTGFGGIYDGVVKRGRRFIAELGHKVDGVDEFFPQGTFIADDPSFDVSPGAIVNITARDLFGIIADNSISLATEVSISADQYIIKILERIGVKPSEYNIPVTTTTLTNTPVIDNESASELLSEVIEYLQLEDNYRLVNRSDVITMEIAKIDVLDADFVFHWINHISAPYRRTDDTLKLLRRITIFNAANPAVTAGKPQGTPSGNETVLPYVHNYTDGPAVRVNWVSGVADTLEIIETARTITSVTFDRRFPAATGNWSASVFGDKFAGVAGEAASGENIRLARGKSRDIINRFIQNSNEAKSLADTIGLNLFSERVRAEFNIGTGWLLGEINDLVRVVEKYSNDKRLYHMARLNHSYLSEQATLRSRVVTEYAGLIEIDQKYDIGFTYDIGRIYDETADVGDPSQGNTNFRGAVITKL